MAYKLEHVQGDHMGVLMETMHKWSNSQPDMYIISEEGHKIYTHKMLVSFYSPTLSSILGKGSSNDMPGISIPESSSSIVNLLKVLATGIAISNIKSDLQVVSRTAESMNIQISNWQIGVKNRGGGKISKQEKKDVVKKNKKSVEKKTEPSVKSEVAENGKEQEKKHSCDECGKQFGRKDHLTRHALIHIGVNYPCDMCGSSFKRKEGLKQHMNKVHDIVPTDEDTSVSVKVEREDKRSPSGTHDDDTQGDAQMNDEAVFADPAQMDENVTEETGCENESTDSDAIQNKASKDNGDIENYETDFSDINRSLKLECPYCQEHVEDLADHCLEKHNDDEILNGIP